MQLLNDSHRIVVKVGSSLLMDGESGNLRTHWLATLADDIAMLQAAGKQVVVVTSGSVALGREVLKLGTGSLELEEKQAAAACGQIGLFTAWSGAFAPYGVSVAQILLTLDDSQHRRRYLNARNTIEKLLEKMALPIINENDTVATTELKFGNNDRLGARVAHMASADSLIMLSDVDGLYTANPRTDKNAVHVAEVLEVTPQIEEMAGGAGSAIGTGGMKTKLEAAKIALSAGCHMVLTNGHGDHPLRRLQEGGRATWFISSTNPLSARKQWISGNEHPGAALVVDKGAEKALQTGKSLLPIGITRIDGEFERGDTVLIRAGNGRIIGRGLVAYNAADARRIIGRHSPEVEAILGFRGRAAMIHRDDMVME